MHVHDHEVITEHLFEHIFEHTIQDTLSLIPFLFIVFVVLEYMEHSMSDKSLEIIKKAGGKGPLLGGIIGAFPQCGFSVMATNLFAGRVISIGTIVAVYLSTSDEMLAVMLSGNTDPWRIFKIIALKTAIGIAAGFGVEFVHRMRIKYQQHKQKHHEHHHEHAHGEHHHHHHNLEGEHHHGEHHEHNEYISDFCIEEDCHGCEHSSVKAALVHTVKIYLVIFVVTFLLNLVIDLAGLEIIEEVVSKAGIWAPVVSCVIGLVPNCASSVAITQLYLSGAISLGTAMAGLLTGSGIAWIVLFRVNPHSRQNFKIMGIVFFVGAVSGIIMNMLGVAI
ncbi:MAG: arsenic efflux protein [Oscillospiraceae bacterium]|nr:arsenic efflux protein [Oscillospiraceae bacterium]